MVAKATDDRQEAAKRYLRFARRDVDAAQSMLDNARRVRRQYVVLAREYGLSYNRIADELGVTQNAVIKIEASASGRPLGE